MRWSLLFLLLALAPIAPVAAAPAATLTVKNQRFLLALPNGKVLTSPDLVGAELATPDGTVFRIDAVAPAQDQPAVLLHRFSIRDERGAWQPACEADAYGRQAGFPVAGRWDANGHYVRDSKHWFLTCTSGAQGKCILWGYDPWGRGPHGEDLTPFYRACQYTVRANYDGKGEAHTKNGTSVDVADVLGIQQHESLADPAYAFEAGWGPTGAVCVARTRWAGLLDRAALIKANPRLGGSCDATSAQRRGALIFTRVMMVPAIGKPPALPTIK